MPHAIPPLKFHASASTTDFVRLRVTVYAISTLYLGLILQVLYLDFVLYVPRSVIYVQFNHQDTMIILSYCGQSPLEFCLDPRHRPLHEVELLL